MYDCLHLIHIQCILQNKTNPPEPRRLPGDFHVRPIGFDTRDLQSWNLKRA